MITEMQKKMGGTIVEIVAPALIMIMTGSLAFFLVELFYYGSYTGRVKWVLGLFVFATVLVSRLSIMESAGKAIAYGFALALATILVLAAIGGVNPLLGLLFTSVVIYVNNKLTWDCTVIDHTKDATDRGLLERVGLESHLSSSSALPETEDENPGLEKESNGEAPPNAPPESGSWTTRFFNKKKPPNTPGVWVIYLALAAFPIYGLGQGFITEEIRRQNAFLDFCLYLIGALGLLVTTAMLGLQRYLVKRNATMPNNVAVTWVGTGVVMIAAILIAAWILPRPYAEYSYAENPFKFESKSWWGTSKNSVGTEGKKEGGSGGNKQEKSESRGGNSKQKDSSSQQSQQSKSNSQSDSKASRKSSGKQSGGKQSGGKQSQGSKSQGSKSQGSKSQGSKSQGSKSQGSKSQGSKSQGSKSQGSKSQGSKSQGSNPKNGKTPNKSSSENRRTESNGEKSQNAQKSDSQNAKSSSKQNGQKNSSSNRNQENETQDPNDQNQAEKSRNSNGDNSQQTSKKSKAQSTKREKTDSKGKNAGAKSSSSQSKSSGNESDAKSSENNSNSSNGNPTQSKSMQIPSFSGVVWIVQVLFWIVIAIAILYFAWRYRKELYASWLKFLEDLRDFWASLFGKKNRKKDRDRGATQPTVPTEPMVPFSAFSNPFTGGQASSMSQAQLIKYTLEALEAWGRERGITHGEDETPHEFAIALTKLDKSIARQAKILADHYCAMAFSPQPTIDPAIPQHLSNLWKGLTAQPTSKPPLQPA